MSRLKAVGKHVEKDRRGARHRHRLGGECEAGADNRIARPRFQRHQRQLQRIGSIGAPEGELGVAEPCQLTLQFGHFRPHDIFAVRQHRMNAIVAFPGSRLQKPIGRLFIYAFSVSILTLDRFSRRLLFYLVSVLENTAGCRWTPALDALPRLPAHSGRLCADMSTNPTP